MEICWNDHLGTFHSLSAPQPPKNGGVLNRVAQILLQRSRNWTLQAFFKRCRQIMNPSNFISQGAPTKSWAFRFQPLLGEEGKVHIIHLLSVRFHMWFHITFDDLCCKQTPKVRSSVLCHILYLYELWVAISSSCYSQGRSSVPPKILLMN